jgi:hypothetical protein
MHFKLLFTDVANEQLESLKNDNSQSKRLKAVRKCLGLMETNLRHPSLQTHEYHSCTGPDGEKVFESYPENNTPGAYRVFWYYGPKQGVITIAAIVPHD